MLKTTAKIFLIFILLITVAVATGFVTYTLTKRIAEENLVETAEAAASKNSADKSEATSLSVPASEPVPVPSEYYTVRLEGATVGVYVTNDGKEEFLYHANVYQSDLSADDLTMLKQGVKLMSLSELTGFIENFTS